MELIIALVVGALVSSGVYLLLRANLFSVVLGLTLLSYAVNIFLFAMGRLCGDAAPIIGNRAMTDPLPQALVLTAIVIGFAMTAFLLALMLRAQSNGNDNDGESERGE